MFILYISYENKTVLHGEKVLHMDVAFRAASQRNGLLVFDLELQGDFLILTLWKSNY